MEAFAHLVSTKKVRRFTVPPAALPEDAAAARRAARDAAHARGMRAFATLAVLGLISVALLISEPWETLRPWLMQP